MRKIENWLWQDCAVTGSTNDLARAYSASFDGRPAVFTAVEQTGGRGRLGRGWISQKGNLFMSLLLKAPARCTDLVFIASLSLAETIAALTKGLDIGIKWPNDILISGSKICGILIEGGEGGSIIIGIGVNLASSPEKGAIIYPVTDLGRCGFQISRETFLRQYLRCFNHNMTELEQQGFAPVRAKWLAFASGLNRPVTVCQGEKKLEGLFKGIDEQGFLLLEQGEKTVKITAGDVFLMR